MKLILLASVAALALTGCTGSNASQNYATLVADVQAAYPLAKVAVNSAISSGVISSSQAAIIQNTVEPQVNAMVGSLSTTSDPTTVKAILSDIQTMVATLPASTTHTDVDIALLAAQTALSLYQGQTVSIHR